MVFSSTVFIFVFLPMILVTDKILPNKAKNLFLVCMSLLFFSWNQPRYLWVILFSVLVNYTGALLVSGIRSQNRKIILAATLMLDMGLLLYFKYLNFGIETINEAFRLEIDVRNIILPIGISFFTFQGMSYVIDVYRGGVQVQKSFQKLALYIVLFPQLVAGPIVRYIDIAQEIDEKQRIKRDYYAGTCRFIIGLGKKVILANNLATIVDHIWESGTGHIMPETAWLGSIAYTLQIYFDFSGYSDMAIGIGRMLGFHFVENFNLPYISKSMSEFWRRWHISLSTWFRDYIYIPLGGNRKNVYLNLFIVFLLTGLWHGAAWHFVLWGGMNGIFVLLERLLKNYRTQTNQASKSTFGKEVLLHIYTLAAVNLGWVMFRAPSLEAAWQYIKAMFGILPDIKPLYSVMWYLTRWNMVILLISIICASSFPYRICNASKIRLAEEWRRGLYNIFLVLVFAYSIIKVVSGTYNPFIYFQF